MVNIADILHSLPWEYCRIHFSTAQWSSRSQEESHHRDPSFQQHLTATCTHPSKQLQALFRTLQERCRTVHPRVGNSAIRGSDVKCKNFMDDFLMKHPLPCPILRAENKVASSRDTYSVRVWSAQQHVSPGILNGLGDVLVCCAGNAGQYHYYGTLSEDDKDPNALIQYLLILTSFTWLQTASNNELIRIFCIIAGFWGAGFWNTPSLDCFFGSNIFKQFFSKGNYSISKMHNTPSWYGLFIQILHQFM